MVLGLQSRVCDCSSKAEYLEICSAVRLSGEFFVLQSHDFEDEIRQLNQDQYCVTVCRVPGMSSCEAPARAQCMKT